MVWNIRTNMPQRHPVDLRKRLRRLENSTKGDIGTTDKKGEAELEQTTRVDGGANIIRRSQQFDVSPDGRFPINAESKRLRCRFLCFSIGNAKPRPRASDRQAIGHRRIAPMGGVFLSRP
jgi:hypothetical protein